MEELIKVIEENLKEDPMFVIGKLTEILGKQHNSLIQLEETYLFNSRFQRAVFKRVPDLFQQIIDELKLEDMANETIQS